MFFFWGKKQRNWTHREVGQVRIPAGCACRNFRFASVSRRLLWASPMEVMKPRRFGDLGDLGNPEAFLLGNSVTQWIIKVKSVCVCVCGCLWVCKYDRTIIARNKYKSVEISSLLETPKPFKEIGSRIDTQRSHPAQSEALSRALDSNSSSLPWKVSFTALVSWDTGHATVSDSRPSGSL